MWIQKNKPEQIVTVLRQIEVQMANGKTVPQGCKEAGIHTQCIAPDCLDTELSVFMQRLRMQGVAGEPGLG